MAIKKKKKLESNKSWRARGEIGTLIHRQPLKAGSDRKESACNAGDPTSTYIVSGNVKYLWETPWHFLKRLNIV